MLNSQLLHQVSLMFSDSFQEYRKDLSALRLTPDNHLWFGSDETSSIKRLSFVDSQNFAKHKQFRVVLDGKVQVYRLRNGVNMRENVLNNPQLLLDLPYGNGNDRPEGITLFQDVTGVSSLLVVYDAPAEDRLLDNSGVMADVFSLG